MSLLFEPFVSGATYSEPKVATTQSAGWDFFAIEDIVINPGEICQVKTNIKLNRNAEIWKMGRACLQLVGKSSLALKGVIVVGGLIDADYEGEILCLLSTVLKDPVHIGTGNAFVQALVIPQDWKLSRGWKRSYPYSGASNATRGTQGFGAASASSYGGNAKVARVAPMKTLSMANWKSMKVLNMRTLGRRLNYAEEKYVGRGNQCLWGNTFGDTEEGLKKYEDWARENRWDQLDALCGYNLVCYCAPNLCHANVLIKLLKEKVDAIAIANDGEMTID